MKKNNSVGQAEGSKEERPSGNAALSGLLFRRGSASPRTPLRQRINNPLDSHFLPPSAFFIIKLCYLFLSLSIIPHPLIFCNEKKFLQST